MYIQGEGQDEGEGEGEGAITRHAAPRRARGMVDPLSCGLTRLGALTTGPRITQLQWAGLRTRRETSVDGHYIPAD